jgi:hypothetical protein
MLGFDYDQNDMRCIILTALFISIDFRISGQNLPAQFINLPLQHLSNTIISEYDSTIKICQYNNPNIFDSHLKIYFSQLDCEKKEITIFDSVELKTQTFRDLGGVISDFAFINNNLCLLGYKSIAVINSSKVLQNIKNKGFTRFLKTQKEFYLARNFPNQLEERSCVVQGFNFYNNMYSIKECVSHKKFTLESLISIYSSSINLVTSNNKDAIFYVNFENNSIDKLTLSSKEKNMYSFSEIGIYTIDSITLEKCIKLQRNYMRNPTEDNLFKMGHAIDSIPHISSISSLKENTIIINYFNMEKEENFFAQLFITQFDSVSTINKEVSWTKNKDNRYTKKHVPYYSFSKRIYTACNNYVVLLSPVDETKLTESFTLEEYQRVRDETRSVKSIILVNLNE